ncbi:MAG: PH domain-containing protein [Ilumatobacteraceae bacterium]
MRARDKIVASAQDRLDGDEQVQAAFAGQPHLRFQWGRDRYRTVIVTDRRVLVFDSGTFSQTKVNELLAELPREVHFGDPTGLWHSITLGDIALLVNRRYYGELAAADAIA